MTLDTKQVENLIAGGESLTVEFKGDHRREFSDQEIYEAVVCLANSRGGVLLIGVEPDGAVTGARRLSDEERRHPERLQAAIFNNTAPPINTRIGLHTFGERIVVAIEVDSYPQVCATRDGKCLRRVVGAHGPECIPFYPHEHIVRRSDLGLLDYSAQLVAGTTWKDLDPLEIERLRQTTDQRRGDRVLLPLSDPEFVQALQLVESHDGEMIPNVAGLLLLGRESVLRTHLPTHGVAFQVLDSRGNVVTNDWLYAPLIRTLEAIEERFNARNEVREMPVGLLRLPVPDYSPDAFREALVNAISHRDYARLGAVHLQFYPDYLMLTSPGGFPEGITLENLLVHEPKPRNARLAEAFRRIGLVETTGRGIDKIYLGQLQYGRPLPDYSSSNYEGVRLIVRGGEASLSFAAFVYEQNRTGPPLGLDELLVLNYLQHERRVDAATIGRVTQRGDVHARAILERLVERGLIEARGERRGRMYHLSAPLYQQLGTPSGYVRTRGFDRIQQETMALQYATSYGSITRSQAAELCNISSSQASNLLRKMAREGKIQIHEAKRGAFYTLHKEDTEQA